MLLLILALIALVGCAGRAAPNTPSKVRVGYLLADLHHLPYAVASDDSVGKGTSLYAKYSLNVEDAVGAPYAQGGAEMDHFAAGDVDVGLLGAPPAITKHLNAKIDTKIIAQINEIGSSLVVDKSIGKFADLAGKTVATPGHSSIQFFLLLSLAQQEGVDVGQINVVDMSPKDMLAKMQSGGLAGFIAWEPFPTEAVATGMGKVLATSNDIWPNHLDCVLAVDRKFADKNPTTVVNFVKAHVEAVNWINSALDRPESEDYQLLLDLASKFTGRSRPVVAEALKTITFKSQIDDSFKDSFVKYTDKLVSFKIVPESQMAEFGYRDSSDMFEKYVDPSFLTLSKK